MAISIDLDVKPDLRAIEVQNICANTVLSSEPIAVNQFPSQLRPKNDLRSRHAPAKHLPSFSQLFPVENLSHLIPLANHFCDSVNVPLQKGDNRGSKLLQPLEENKAGHLLRAQLTHYQ